MVLPRIRISRTERWLALLAVGAAALWAIPTARYGWLPDVEGLDFAQSFAIVFGHLSATALVLIWVYRRSLGRHLRQIRRQMNLPALGPDSAISLHRKRPQHDELDHFVQLLNKARSDAHEAHLVQTRRLAELARLNEKLSDIHQEQSKFAYALSHDLKTPSNTIAMLLGEFRDAEGDRIGAEASATLDDLLWASDRLDMLIKDVLNFSRAVQFDPTNEAVDLEEMMQGIIRDLTAALKEAGARVEIGPLPYAAGSAFQFRALFKNLLSNAIKFHGADTAPVIEISGRTTEVEGWVEISVRDNGVGIAPEQQDQMVQMFSRSYSQSEYQGSGMGLALCKQIVADHGGRIELHSEVGVGSTFTVRLPGRAKDQAETVPEPPEQEMRNLRFGLNTPPGHPWTKAARTFADALFERSGGTIRTQVLPMHVTIEAEEVLTHVQSGALDIAFVPLVDIADIAPDLGCLFTPFLADDVAHAGRILKTDAAAALLEQLPERAGVMGLGFGMGGMRQIICRAPLDGPEDLAGVPIRMPYFVPFVDFYRLLKAEVVPLPLQTAHKAFAEGLVDATDSDAQLGHKLEYHKLAQVLFHTDHMMLPMVATVSLKLWKTLSEEDRSLIAALLREHSQSSIDAYGNWDGVLLEQIHTSGLTVRKLHREAFAPVIRDWIGIWRNRSPSLDSILEAAEATREEGEVKIHQNLR